MRKALYLVAGLAVFISAGAFAQSVPERTGVNSLLGVAPKTADFVKQVAISDMFEIASSKLAEEKGGSQVKTFASRMVIDHTKTTNELKGMVAKAKAELPQSMDNAHQSKLDKLKGLSGVEFDKQYSADQVSAHNDAVDLFERYAKGGENADLKAWAAKTLPALKHHQDMAATLPK